MYHMSTNFCGVQNFVDFMGLLIHENLFDFTYVPIVFKYAIKYKPRYHLNFLKYEN